MKNQSIFTFVKDQLIFFFFQRLYFNFKHFCKKFFNYFLILETYTINFEFWWKIYSCLEFWLNVCPFQFCSKIKRIHLINNFRKKIVLFPFCSKDDIFWYSLLIKMFLIIPCFFFLFFNYTRRVILTDKALPLSVLELAGYESR